MIVMNQKNITAQRETLLKTYQRRLKDDVKSIFDNYTEIIRTVKIEEESQIAHSTQAVQDGYEIDVRASNIVRAGESLMKLISDIKEFLILNDFPAVTASLQKRAQLLKSIEEETKKVLYEMREDLNKDLQVLEHEYYSSKYK